MSKIVFSDEAVNDLKEIKAYISEDLCNEIAAKNTVSEIIKQIGILERFPNTGTLLSSIIKVDTDYRFLICGNYTAFYKTDSSNVYIMRILYGKRDFMRCIFK